MRRWRGGALVGALVAVALVGAACGDGDDDDRGEGAATTTTSEAARTTTAPGAPGEALPDEVTAELEAALADTMAEYQVPGAVVGVWVSGQGEWVVAEGDADLETDEAVGLDLHWPIRSITKTFTTTAMLQLADEGRLSLDDTVDQYLDGVPGGDQITLRQLAYMDSGLADYAATEAFAETFGSDPTHQFTLDELNAFAFAEPLDFEPGSQHVYSNTNTNVIGSIVEEVAGQSIDEVIAERFVEPLGLSSTSYAVDDSQYPEPHPTLYSPDPDAGELGADPPIFSGLAAAGAMISQVDDLRTWVEALAGGELVEQATHEARLTATPLEGPEYDAYGTGIGTIEGWWGHTGEGLGATALAMHDRESGATVVILMNISNVDRHPPTVLFREVATILRDAGLVTTSAADPTTTTTG